MRESNSLAESCARACVLQLTQCGGPTANGVDGYACERCLEHVVAECERGHVAADVVCGYCGSQAATRLQRGAPICTACARSALAAAQSWYEREDSD